MLEHLDARGLGAPAQQYRGVDGIGQGEPGDENQGQREIHRVEEVAPCEHQEEKQDERQVDEPVDAPRGGVRSAGSRDSRRDARAARRSWPPHDRAATLATRCVPSLRISMNRAQARVS